MKLPKAIRNHQKAKAIETLLDRPGTKLWEGGSLLVPNFSLSQGLAQGLSLAKGSGDIILGLDQIKAHFASAPKSEAASWQHLLVLTDGGSERFYRAAETLLNKAPHILCLKIDVDATVLGQALYKKDKAIQALLISSPKTMAKVLFFMAAEA